MNIEDYRNFCLAFPGVTEEFPFGNHTLVFKVKGKMFTLCDVDEFRRINVKCEPIKAIELRETYPGIVIPGYHMNKKHWNSILMDNNLPNELIESWIRDSYDLVVAKLPKKLQKELNEE